MIVVFTDLDGTLLDHDSYSFEPAKPALHLLAERGIPLVLASSKTEAEMRPIADAIGIAYPMIVENGAGIVDLPGRKSEVANHYESLRALLKSLPEDLSHLFQGFGDWSEEEVASQTGLPLAAVRLARKRRFSEPGLFSGDDRQKAEFIRHVEAAGYHVAQGGRFLTLMPRTSKAERMAEIVAHYRESLNEDVRTIALGDAPNDLVMLQAADTGIIIANPSHTPLPVTERETHGFILRSPIPGPAGWNHMIHTLVETGF